MEFLKQTNEIKNLIKTGKSLSTILKKLNQLFVDYRVYNGQFADYNHELILLERRISTFRKEKDLKNEEEKRLEIRKVCTKVLELIKDLENHIERESKIPNREKNSLKTSIPGRYRKNKLLPAALIIVSTLLLLSVSYIVIDRFTFHDSGNVDNTPEAEEAQEVFFIGSGSVQLTLEQLANTFPEKQNLFFLGGGTVAGENLLPSSFRYVDAGLVNDTLQIQENLAYRLIAMAAHGPHTSNQISGYIESLSPSVNTRELNQVYGIFLGLDTLRVVLAYRRENVFQEFITDYGLNSGNTDLPLPILQKLVREYVNSENIDTLNFQFVTTSSSSGTRGLFERAISNDSTSVDFENAAFYGKRAHGFNEIMDAWPEDKIMVLLGSDDYLPNELEGESYSTYKFKPPIIYKLELTDQNYSIKEKYLFGIARKVSENKHVYEVNRHVSMYLKLLLDKLIEEEKNEEIVQLLEVQRDSFLHVNSRGKTLITFPNVKGEIPMVYNN